MTPSLHLTGFSFDELFHSDGLNKLDQAFLTTLKNNDPTLHQQLTAYRSNTLNLTQAELGDFLIKFAIILEQFLAQLFKIEEAISISQLITTSNNQLSIFKKYYVLRHAKKNLLKANDLPSFQELDQWLDQQLKQFPLQTDDQELAVALLGNDYLKQPETHKDEIEKLIAWSTQALATPEGQQQVKTWSTFRIPERIDFEKLVKYKSSHGRLESTSSDLYFRDGFKLTDPGMNARGIQDEVNYCIYCHDHDGDFCSKGFPQKKGQPELGFKNNPLDYTLTGCPLDEKISEMNLLKRDGHTLAALAVVMIDNPMCPATGHRICNDCMKACVYQKQDPVNVPQIETRVLLDVLDLPWGVEIYDLLTRWNPLRQDQFTMKPYNGLKVMIAGMGPAGFTLAHHLLLEGFAVVGFDGLKIEPLPEQLITQPIYSYQNIKEQLDERLMAGFGGVAEYGITVRWDKNFLKLIYISLMRKPYFQVFGSVRFGGTIKVEDAWEMGFDHFVIAVGAGLPKALAIPGSLAPGMRQANDFLMALQLGNAAKAGSLTNIQMRLPAVIIGGGLTGVDTATEAQAYYIRQVEKILYRHEKLCEHYGEDAVVKNLDAASLEILEEFLTHGKAVRQERLSAAKEKRLPNFIKLVRQWGGVTIVYRRIMQESPAYLNNHEEIQKALQEGIYYREALEPIGVDLNQYGHVETLVCHSRLEKSHNEWEATTEQVRIPARSIFVATGTKPNTAYEFEHKGTFHRMGLQYQHYEDRDGELTVAHGIENCKEEGFGPFTSYHHHDKRVSLIGDTHPVFHGSVVKAIASGKNTYPKIVALLQHRLQQKINASEYDSFAKKMEHLFQAKVTNIIRRTPDVIELTVQAPLAAKHFRAGQFYRLQNYETHAPRIDTTSLQIEPVALIASKANHTDGTLTFIIFEKGASTKLCATFKNSDPISLMGPTGVRAKVATEHETILIIGNQLSLPLVQSYGNALKDKGNKVLYLGFFDNKEEVYCQPEIEAATDAILWCIKSGDKIIPQRAHDVSEKGDPFDLLLKYAKGCLDCFVAKSAPRNDDDRNNDDEKIRHCDTDHECNEREGKTIQNTVCYNNNFISLKDVDRIYIVAPTQFMRRFQETRNTTLKEYLIKDPHVFGSVYSTMQCMLKGVCAQCLQWQIDPETGQRTKAVFACSWPDQPLELIDFDNIDERQIQNRLQEHYSSLWVDYLFDKYDISRV